jgi:hypothetical protein
LALEQADYRRAAAQLGEALGDPAEPQRRPKELVLTLELVARLALRMGQPDHALLLVSGATALRRRAVVLATPHQQTENDATAGEARHELGDEAAETIWARGATMTAEELLQYSQRAVRELRDAGQGAEPRPRS